MLMSDSSKGLNELHEIEQVFKALAHASRRHILIVMNARGGNMTAGAIARRFSCSWPTTSRHLRMLANAGLVTIQKQGREWVYVLESKTLQRVVGEWLNWFNVEHPLSDVDSIKETE